MSFLLFLMRRNICHLYRKSFAFCPTYICVDCSCFIFFIRFPPRGVRLFMATVQDTHFWVLCESEDLNLCTSLRIIAIITLMLMWPNLWCRNDAAEPGNEVLIFGCALFSSSCTELRVSFCAWQVEIVFMSSPLFSFLFSIQNAMLSRLSVRWHTLFPMVIMNSFSFSLKHNKALIFMRGMLYTDVSVTC